MKTSLTDSLASINIFFGIPLVPRMQTMSTEKYYCVRNYFVAAGVFCRTPNAEYHCLFTVCFTYVCLPAIAFICKLLQRANTI